MESQTIQASALSSQHVKTTDWVLTFIISCIPIVNFVMFFVWAFGSGTNPSKATWARAALLLIAISAILYLVMVLAFGVALFNGAF